MKKAGVFGPRGWYKGLAMVTFVHPLHKAKPEEVQAIEKTVEAEARVRFAAKPARHAPPKEHHHDSTVLRPVV
jgi:hypothetical protein